MQQKTKAAPKPKQAVREQPETPPSSTTKDTPEDEPEPETPTPTPKSKATPRKPRSAAKPSSFAYTSLQSEVGDSIPVSVSYTNESLQAAVRESDLLERHFC